MSQLLVETVNRDLEILTESTGAGTKLYIEGPFLMTNARNRNGRLYERGRSEAMVDRYQKEYITERRAIGELNHPDYPLPNIKEAALMTQSLDWHGDNVNGKALILNTPEGDRIRALTEANFNLGVSSRAIGTVTRKGDTNVVDDGAVLNAIDAVDMPSAQNCYVNALTESVNWAQDSATGLWVKKGLNEGKIIQTLEEVYDSRNTELLRRLEKLADSL